MVLAFRDSGSCWLAGEVSHRTDLLRGYQVHSNQDLLRMVCKNRGMYGFLGTVGPDYYGYLRGYIVIRT